MRAMAKFGAPLALASLALGGALAHAQSPTGSSATAPPTPAKRASAMLLSCHADPLQANRYAAYEAQMTAVHNTKLMGVRFDLLERVPRATGYTRYSAPGLGSWQTSSPGIRLFSVRPTVVNLPAPARFLAEVSFRWYGAKHAIIRRAHHATAVCKMPDERPTLVVGAITHTPGPNHTELYTVIVRNDGLGPAGAFAVALSIDGTPLTEQTLPGIGAGTRSAVTFSGTRCTPPSQLQVVVDPTNQIDQTTRAGDTNTVTC